MIYYEQIKELGFERYDYHDNVVWKKTGHHPFHMTKKADKNVVIYWYSSEDPLEVLRLDKEENVKGRLSIQSMKQLIDLLIFYGFREEVKAFMENQVKV